MKQPVEDTLLVGLLPCSLFFAGRVWSDLHVYCLQLFMIQCIVLLHVHALLKHNIE